MTTFRYKAISNDGAEVAGVIEAYDEFEAIDQIKKTCKIITGISEVKNKRYKVDWNEPLWVSDRSLAVVSSQFGILLRAGLPMVRTVELIAEQTSDRLVARILRQVADDVAAGYSMAHSLELRGTKLPTTFIETVRAGEESGTLETSFEKLYDYYNKSAKIKQKVRAAMIYPTMLCVLAVIVIGIIMVVLVPTMTSMYTKMDMKLPLSTRILIGTSLFLGKFWPLLVIVLLSLYLAGKAYGRTDRGRMLFAVAKLKFPVLGKINTLKVASQFCNTMSTLLTAGLPLTKCLVISGKVMDNYAAGKAVMEAVLTVEQGKRAGEAIHNNPYLPAMVIEMTGIGEESGSLEETLSTIGQYYDSEIEIQSGKVLAMLEPTITIVMGLIVAFIVISIYVPMFNMYGGLT